MSVLSFSALAGSVSLFEANGTVMEPVRYDAKLSDAEREEARLAVAFGAVWDTLTCRMAGRRPERVTA